MKRILSYILPALCLAAVISLVACSGIKTKTQDEILKDIETTIEAFYENKDLDMQKDFSEALDENTFEELEDRLAAYRNGIAPHKFGKENYKIDVHLLEVSELDNENRYKYQVTATYNYASSPEIDTTVSDEVIVLYDNDKYEITGISFISYWTDID